MDIIYIKLLDEGTEVYRPVPAIQMDKDVFKLQGFEIYDKETEKWEFEPGNIVIVTEKQLSNELVLIAVKLA